MHTPEVTHIRYRVEAGSRARRVEPGRMNKKLDVGGTLSEVFSIYGANAGVLLPVAFWLFLVVAILNGIAGSSLFLLLLASVVGIAAGTLYQGTVVNLVRDVQDGRRDFSAGELLSQATPFIAAADRGRHPGRDRRSASACSC